MKFYRSPFLRDFWHLNVAMMTSNNALIPDPDKEDILASVPTDWPLMRLGLRMCAWVNMQTKYYLIGTPIIWWGATASLVISVLAFCTYVFRMQRRSVDMEPSTCRTFKRKSCLCSFLEKLNQFARRRMGTLFVCGQDCAIWLDTSLPYAFNSLCPSFLPACSLARMWSD
jgi:dolichyl-phosphate-mannose--protein O-mannosyl transferase